jgi:hypothetical protein
MSLGDYDPTYGGLYDNGDSGSSSDSSSSGGGGSDDGFEVNDEDSTDDDNDVPGAFEDDSPGGGSAPGGGSSTGQGVDQETGGFATSPTDDGFQVDDEDSTDDGDSSSDVPGSFQSGNATGGGTSAGQGVDQETGGASGAPTGNESGTTGRDYPDMSTTSSDVPGAYEDDSPGGGSAPGGGSSTGQGVDQDEGGASGIPLGGINLPATEDAAAYVTDPDFLDEGQQLPEWVPVPVQQNSGSRSGTVVLLAVLGAIVFGIVGFVTGGSD